MIYGFVQQSGGHVQISSTVGQGTTVPRHDGAEQTSAREGGAASPAQATGEGTVLVVDDEPPVRMLISDLLTDLGYSVHVAWDGASALQVMNSLARVDLLVTDVGMPGGMNGWQLAEAARQQRPGLKVLFITGYAATTLSGKGMLGMDIKVMAKAIRHIRSSRQDPHHVGERSDPGRRTKACPSVGDCRRHGVG
jgi:CheY-like chemotaxis protein